MLLTGEMNSNSNAAAAAAAAVLLAVVHAVGSFIVVDLAPFLIRPPMSSTRIPSHRLLEVFLVISECEQSLPVLPSRRLVMADVLVVVVVVVVIVLTVNMVLELELLFSLLLLSMSRSFIIVIVIAVFLLYVTRYGRICIVDGDKHCPLAFSALLLVVVLSDDDDVTVTVTVTR